MLLAFGWLSPRLSPLFLAILLNDATNFFRDRVIGENADHLLPPLSIRLLLRVQQRLHLLHLGFKALEPGEVRISLRSKYDVDVRAVAVKYGGGGHTNAAGFTLRGPEDHVRAQVIDDVIEAIERAAVAPRTP